MCGYAHTCASVHFLQGKKKGDRCFNQYAKQAGSKPCFLSPVGTIGLFQVDQNQPLRHPRQLHWSVLVCPNPPGWSWPALFQCVPLSKLVENASSQPSSLRQREVGGLSVLACPCRPCPSNLMSSFLSRALGSGDTASMPPSVSGSPWHQPRGLKDAL